MEKVLILLQEHAIVFTVLVLIVTLSWRNIWRLIAKGRHFAKGFIYSTDPELNRYVIQNEMRVFKQGWPPQFAELLGESSILLTFGDVHKLHRSNFLGFLNSARLQSSFLRDAEKLASDVMGPWADGSVVSVREEAKKFTFKFIVRQAMGFGSGDLEVERLLRAYGNFFNGLVATPVNFPGTDFRKALLSRAEIKSIIQQKMKEKIQKKKKEGGETEKMEEDDFLDWLMNNTSYSTEEIVAQLITFLFGGYDTTSKSLPAAIYFLEHCPEALQQMREEHIQAVRSVEQSGETQFTLENYRKMDFTQAVILETLRLANVSSSLQKKAIKDSKFKEYVIPSGYVVMANSSSVHTNPAYFEEPERFNPWRWLTPSGIKRSNYLTPFGGGVRHCVGSELAKMEMAVFLHHLILNFKWESVEKEKPIPVPHLEFMNGLQIKVEKFAYGH